jgi:hypothetical protein
MENKKHIVRIVKGGNSKYIKFKVYYNKIFKKPNIVIKISNDLPYSTLGKVINHAKDFSDHILEKHGDFGVTKWIKYSEEFNNRILKRKNEEIS